ncbi:MAG TPA: energy transducer TonB [Chthoniobacteraceae bacterium]|jgi:hypothetical protein|nr:energy transducer TonB [Chthoniobacteraceae bacterium]
MKKLFVAIVSVCLTAKTSAAAEHSTRTVAREDAAVSKAAPPPDSLAAKKRSADAHAVVRVTTDSFGNVTRAVVVEKSGSIPDRDIISLAETWKGPPLASRTIPIVYQIDPEKAPRPPTDVMRIGPGWRTVRPPYPAKAMAARAQGKGVFRISTNRDGRVEKVEIIEKIHPLLDGYTAGFARAHWTGPPNTTRDVPVSYQLK